MATLELHNESDREFIDISSEVSRTYILADGTRFDIENPQYLSVSASGNHYVVALNGEVAVIPTGWLLLIWRPREGAPHLVA